MVLTGKTIARIGECHVEGDGQDGIGEVLITDSANCNKKELFANAMKDLIVHLQTIGQVNNNYNISNDAVFNSSFLHTYFGIQNGDIVKWNNDIGIYSITINGQQRSSFQIYLNNNSYIFNSSEQIVDFDINGIFGSYNNGGHNITLSYISNNTNNVVLNGKLTSYFGETCIAKYPLYFACCSPCGEWDLNGNGIGDLCDEPSTNVVACNLYSEQELTYENNLKNTINYILANKSVFYNSSNQSGNYNYSENCNSVSEVASFIDQSHLLNAFQQLRNNFAYNYNVPVELTKFNIHGTNGNNFYLNFLGDEHGSGGSNTSWISISSLNILNIKSINYIDIVDESHLNIEYIDVNNVTNFGQSLTFSNYTKNTFSTSSGIFFCRFLSFVNNNQNAKNIELQNLEIHIPSCENNVTKEELFETNLKESFNFAIQNSQNILFSVQSVSVIKNLIINSGINSCYNNYYKETYKYDDYEPTPLNFEFDTFNFSSTNDNGSVLAFHTPNDANNADSVLYFKLLDFDYNGVSSIQDIDFKGIDHSYVINNLPPYLTGYTVNNVSINYIDLNGITQTGNFYFAIYTQGFSHDYVTDLCTVMSSCEKEIVCDTCIPQTVTPVSCTEKYSQYVQKITELNIQYFNIAEIESEKDFCSSNFQYLVDSYIYYLQTLGITSMENPNYMSISQFGHTNLNYGYNNIINLYSIYNATPVNNPNLYLWNDYVDLFYFQTIMKDCPPKPLPTFSTPIDFVDSCAEMLANISATYQSDSYDSYIQQLRDKFIRDYIDQAMSTVVENFKLEFDDKEYQYTLYYYDQSGNLIKTVAPEGVKRLDPNQNVAIDSHRSNNLAAENTALLPNHGFITEYKYNSLNQLVWQKTPDGGTTRFAYDNLGRIIASQNAKQANLLTNPGYERFSYSQYDGLGRVYEAGEISVSEALLYSISDEGRLLLKGNTKNQIDQGYKTEVTRTTYDVDPEVENISNLVRASDLFITNTTSGYNPSYNNRNRVTGVFYYDSYVETLPLNFDNALLYNYDVHGNVKEMITYISYLRNLPCSSSAVIDVNTGRTNDCEQYLKRIVYDYDLISGNVNKVTFQPNKIDQFVHRYNYDADNRIVNVETSSDGKIWEKDAGYQYYSHGPLARVEIGDKKIQGVDYVYTLQGWLKAVNVENITSPYNDVGNDGLLINGKTKTNDAFGYSLNYYNTKSDKDYVAIENDNVDATFKPLMYSRNNTIAGSIKDLYNGNIKSMVTAIRKESNSVLPVQKNNYTYDQLNRISNMTSVSITPSTGAYTNSYSSGYTYDRNGNLKTLNRTAVNSNSQLENMDELEYFYKDNNQLTIVADHVNGSFTNDLKNQIDQLTSMGYGPYDINNMDTHNYVYDEIGQLVEDKTEDLHITWKVDGKVKLVRKTLYGGSYYENIQFGYDGLGNRISKSIQTSSRGRNSSKTTYYSRDAQGNPLGVYDFEEKNDYTTGDIIKYMYLTEHNIYGSSRLGLESKDIAIYNFGSKKIVKPDLPPKKGVLSKDISLKDKNLISKTFSINPVFRNYSLHFDPGTIAQWQGNQNLLDPDLTNFSLNTKIKVENTPLPNGDFKIGELINYGKKNINSVVIGNLNFLSESCITITDQGSQGIDLLRNNGLILTGPILKKDTTVSKRPSSDTDVCPSIVEAKSLGTLNSSEDGYISFVLRGTAAQNIKVGFETVNGFCGYQTIGFNLFLVVPSLPNVPLGVFTGQTIGSFKIERVGGQIKFNDNINHTFALPITNLDAIVSFGSSAGIVQHFKVFKYINEEVKVANKLELYINKETNGFKPKIDLIKFSEHENGTVVKEKASYSSNSTLTTNEMNNSGMELSFNLSLNNSTSSNNIIVNGSSTNFANPSVLIADNSLGNTPLNIVNTLGNSSLPFEMCYLDYTLSALNPVGSSTENSFTFDDVTSHTDISNLPKNTLGTVVMAVSPSVIRTLGPCLEDQDGDGLFDIYEVNYTSNIGNNYVIIDTDGDGLPNHMDKDDDGIYTINEEADPDGDHNPNAGLATLNTDESQGANPNIQTDNIPNYLDDDGYAT